MRLKKTSICILLLQIVFFFILEIGYQYFIVPRYDDYGFFFRFSPSNYVWSKVIFLFVMGLVIGFTSNDFIFALLNILISFFLIPNLILYQFMDAPIVIVLGIAAIPPITILLYRFVPSIKWKVVSDRQRLPTLFFISIILLIPFLVTFGFSISSDVLSFEKVYDVRLQSAKIGTTITDYTYSLLSTWVLPMCLIYGYWKRYWSLFLFSIVSLLYLYAISGNKVTFFVVLVVIAFLFFESFRTKTIAMLCSLIFLFAVGLLLRSYIPSIGDLLIRRFLFLPALLNIQYHEFFHDEPVYYSHSFLSSYLTYPHGEPPPKMIGDNFYKGGNMTNGIISDGYLNLGVIGIFLNSFFASTIIVFFAKLKIHPIFLGLFFLLVQKFIDTGLLTGLLTHGIFLFAVLATFLLRKTLNPINTDE